jgi:hypothetical protein
MIIRFKTKKDDIKGFYKLLTSGKPVVCLPNNTYEVRPDHLLVLDTAGIPYEILKADKQIYDSIRNPITTQI